MHKNSIWLGFLGVITLALLWYTYGSVTKVREYFVYDKEISAVSADWHVKELSKDQYLLSVDYLYAYKNKNYRKNLPIKKYENPWAAEQMKKKYASKPLKLWISTNNPHYSTLEISFPLKELISTFILWSLWLYFIWLGFYVTRYN